MQQVVGGGTTVAGVVRTFLRNAWRQKSTVPTLGLTRRPSTSTRSDVVASESR